MCFWLTIGVRRRVMVINVTFNNISAILWRSVLFVEESGVPGENHRPATNQWQTLSHNVISSTPRLGGIRTHNVSGDLDTDWIGNCRSNYHTITTTTAPWLTIIEEHFCKVHMNEDFLEKKSYTSLYHKNNSSLIPYYNTKSELKVNLHWRNNSITTHKRVLLNLN